MEEQSIYDEKTVTSTSIDHSYSKPAQSVDYVTPCSGSNGALIELNQLYTECIDSDCLPLPAHQNITSLDSHTLTPNFESYTEFLQTSEQKCHYRYHEQQRQQPQNLFSRNKPPNAESTTVSYTQCSPTNAQVPPSPSFTEFLTDIFFDDSMPDIHELEEYLDAPNDAALLHNSFELMMNEGEQNDKTKDLTHPADLHTSNSNDMDIALLKEFFPTMPSNNAIEMKKSVLGKPSDYLEGYIDLELYCDSKKALKSQQEDSSVTSMGDSQDASTGSDIDYMEISDYRRKRDRNNISSQKSRRKRQEKFKAMKLEEQTLKKRNAELLMVVSNLERQVCNLKDIMMKAVTAR